MRYLPHFVVSLVIGLVIPAAAAAAAGGFGGAMGGMAGGAMGGGGMGGTGARGYSASGAVGVTSTPRFLPSDPEDPGMMAPPVLPGRENQVVQVAILLDTSDSMSGLIDQAKTQLWLVINEISRAQIRGLRQEIEVALYHYGTPALGAENNYVRQLVPLVTDLDRVSAELFKLKTSGGQEYCGAVIQQALNDLKWSDDPLAYRAIFIAGNEPFSQGPVNFREACKAAAERGVTVNTIFCGADAEGVRTFWKEGAEIGRGQYASINQNTSPLVARAPQDSRLAILSAQLNATYIPFGADGKTGAANQIAQDANAARAAEVVAAERAITKASGAYRNAHWDLVDAVAEGRVALKDLRPEDLPPEIAALDEPGRAAYVTRKLEERRVLQAEIKKLAEERDAFLASATTQPTTRPAGQ